MTSPLVRRVPVVLVLLGVLSVLCAWYATLGVAPDLGAYPTEHAVGPNATKYVGELVTLSGTVVATDPAEMRVSYGEDQQRTLTITELETSIEEGDQLRVFGTLTDETTVRATTAFTVPPVNFLYTYAISFLAGVWVLVRILTQWRLDTAGIVRRTGTRSPLDHLRHRLTGDTPDDA